jgi:hypothetical protein
MSAIPYPANETARLEALKRYAVLDTPSESVFERFAALTARVFDAPIAIVGFVDESRHWFKSAIGTDLHENARTQSFCTYTILEDGVFQVPNALEDSRFNDLPVVRDIGIRAYAGAPLTTPDGFRIGSLCIFDHAPRAPLSLEEQDQLQQLAALVMNALEERLARLTRHQPRLEAYEHALEDVLNALHLKKQPMFGRGAETPPPDSRFPIPNSQFLNPEDRLIARIRATAPSPTPAFLTRLPDHRVLISHAFGFAPPGSVWQAWALTKTDPPRALEAFVAPVAVLRVPPDTALLLLSEEPRGSPSSTPTRVMASGSLE